MIPHMNIVAWSNIAPWASFRQVEQDLIISRAVIEIFNDDYLREELRFRGGTALNKLHFPTPLRYSEDIDLVRTTKGPIKEVICRLRETLEPWLGEAEYESSKVAPKLLFRVPAEEEGQLRLKVEIVTFETEAFDEPLTIKHAADNPWFTGEAEIPTYSREEMLATKLRALLQREQGRDLFDLARALSIFNGLDLDRIVELLARYLNLQGQSISRAQAEQRMFGKLAQAGFLADVRPLLSAEQADGLTEKSKNASFVSVFDQLVSCIPGEPWKRTNEMKERFGLVT